jgi:multiple sugar transport system ATP-binding protein
MVSVSLNKLEKHFGAVPVIHGIDLDIEDGEFVALVGPSGCGKSTLLRIIAGLEDPSSGQIQFGEKVVNDLNPRKRNIAMVFQSYALYPHMNVADNMSFNLKLARQPKTVINERVGEAARMLDLGALLDRRPMQLSGGQRQRVAMGRAVVRNPQVFLFDEPLSNLDAKLRVQMRAEIKTLHQKVKTTSIYVTHDQIEAMTLADRIIVLDGGRIQQQGSPMELYRQPSNIFVAGFIGSPAMNFIDATFEHGKARLSDGTVLTLPPVRAEEGRKLVIGVRPETILLGEGENKIDFKVAMVEPTGAQTHLHLSAAEMSVVAVVDSALETKVGSLLPASLPASGLHVFDRNDGMRLNAAGQG